VGVFCLGELHVKGIKRRRCEAAIAEGKKPLMTRLNYLPVHLVDKFIAEAL